MIDAELTPDAHPEEDPVVVGEIVVDAEVVLIGIIGVGRRSKVVVGAELPALDVGQRVKIHQRPADRIEAARRNDIVRERVSDGGGAGPNRCLRIEDLVEVAALHREVAVARKLSWNGREQAAPEANSRPLVAEEPERLVLDDRPAESNAELVLAQRGLDRA